MITIDVEQLLPTLISAVGVAKDKGNPILGNILVETNDHGINIIATDNEIEIQQSVVLDNLVPGSCNPFLVSASSLLNVCKALPKKATISIEIMDGKETKGNEFTSSKIIIKAGRSKFELPTLPVEDFPTMKHVSVEFATDIDIMDMIDMLHKVSFAIAVNDARYFLNGMLMEFETNKLNCVATDGHRLAFTCIPRIPIPTGFSKLIPREAVLLLAKTLAKHDGMLNFETGDGYCRFSFDDTIITTKLIDGKFPEYQRVIPKNLPEKALINREELEAALVQTMIAKDGRYHGVKLTFDKGQLDIVTTTEGKINVDVGLSVEYKGKNIIAGFNNTYLLDVIKTMICETIELKIADHLSSISISEPDDPDTIYVVMPMRL